MCYNRFFSLFWRCIWDAYIVCLKLTGEWWRTTTHFNHISWLKFVLRFHNMVCRLYICTRTQISLSPSLVYVCVSYEMTFTNVSIMNIFWHTWVLFWIHRLPYLAIIIKFAENTRILLLKRYQVPHSTYKCWTIHNSKHRSMAKQTRTRRERGGQLHVGTRSIRHSAFKLNLENIKWQPKNIL